MTASANASNGRVLNWRMSDMTKKERGLLVVRGPKMRLVLTEARNRIVLRLCYAMDVLTDFVDPERDLSEAVFS